MFIERQRFVRRVDGKGFLLTPRSRNVNASETKRPVREFLLVGTDGEEAWIRTHQFRAFRLD